MSIETILLILAVIAGAYMAWNIGANDVANAMGTSVGSKAITLMGAVVIAGIFEFAGAFFVGSRVTKTISKNIIDLDVIRGLDPDFMMLFAAGMVSALFAAAIWLNIASRLGWPVSTTHSIIGAVIGFGLVMGGMSAINWGQAAKIAASWVISPVSGALLSVAIYLTLVTPIYQSPDPIMRLRRTVPLAAALVFFLLSLSMVYKGLKNLHLDLPLGEAIMISAMVGCVAYGIAHIIMVRRKLDVALAKSNSQKLIEPIFAVLQVITASYMAFAHGANDVANAIGPLAAVVNVVTRGDISSEVPVPMWVLALGGVGIVIGLATYGYRVMATIGEKITTITPSRGFAAEFGCATTVLICSKMGLPISTTHTLVGAVIGVGLVRGLRGIDLQVVKNIALSWLYTIPFTAVLTILIFLVLRSFV